MPADDDRRPAMTTRWLAIGVVAALVVAALIYWLLVRGDDRLPRRRPATTHVASSRRLDVEQFRTSYRVRLERAKEVVRRRAARSAAAAAAAAAAKPSDGGATLLGEIGRKLIEPRCLLGPGEICDVLFDPIVACEQGDGHACLAVGQYLDDTPPFPAISILFHLEACRKGEQDGCTRQRAFDGPLGGRCEEDPVLCTHVALRDKDLELLDQACAAGVSDACAFMMREEDDPARIRMYLETACQLGGTGMCNELARRLSDDCVPTEELPCYPPDEAQAREARAIACEAGFAEACA